LSCVKKLGRKKILPNKVAKMIPTNISLPTHMLLFLPPLYETLTPLLQATSFLTGRAKIRAQKMVYEVELTLAYTAV
jgi:hypothetical protein